MIHRWFFLMLVLTAPASSAQEVDIDISGDTEHGEKIFTDGKELFVDPPQINGIFGSANEETTNTKFLVFMTYDQLWESFTQLRAEQRAEMKNFSIEADRRIKSKKTVGELQAEAGLFMMTHGDYADHEEKMKAYFHKKIDNILGQRDILRKTLTEAEKENDALRKQIAELTQTISQLKNNTKHSGNVIEQTTKSVSSSCFSHSYENRTKNGKFSFMNVRINNSCNVCAVANYDVFHNEVRVGKLLWSQFFGPIRVGSHSSTRGTYKLIHGNGLTNVKFVSARTCKDNEKVGP